MLIGDIVSSCYKRFRPCSYYKINLHFKVYFTTLKWRLIRGWEGNCLLRYFCIRCIFSSAAATNIFTK